MHTIERASQEDVPVLVDLAARIWREHYPGIISTEQIEYMLQKFQSTESVTRQIREEGYVYYMAYAAPAHTPAGFCGVCPEGDFLYISKLYVDSAYRHAGIARDFITRIVSDFGDHALRLHVNKHNESAIAAYKKMGFAVATAVVNDIGGGFVMDDYVMEKKGSCLGV